MSLPTDPKARKDVPLFTGFLAYFPDACAAVAELSRIGNEQHNPGEPLHWARGKSMDQTDCIVRHLMEAGTVDTDGVRHSAKVAWRALANLQLELEALAGVTEAETEPENWPEAENRGPEVPSGLPAGALRIGGGLGSVSDSYVADLLAGRDGAWMVSDVDGAWWQVTQCDTDDCHRPLQLAPRAAEGFVPLWGNSVGRRFVYYAPVPA